MRAKYLLITCIFPFFLNNLFSQKSDLSPMEAFAFSENSEVVYPRDDIIGILDEDEIVEKILADYINKGPGEEFCDGNSLKVLDSKHTLMFGTIENSNYILRLQRQRESNGGLSSKFRVLGDDYKIKGTIYLKKNEGKWLLFDIEAED